MATIPKDTYYAVADNYQKEIKARDKRILVLERAIDRILVWGPVRLGKTLWEELHEARYGRKPQGGLE